VYRRARLGASIPTDYQLGQTNLGNHPPPSLNDPRVSAQSFLTASPIEGSAVCVSPVLQNRATIGMMSPNSPRTSDASRGISGVHVKINGHLNPHFHTRPLINGLETTLTLRPKFLLDLLCPADQRLSSVGRRNQIRCFCTGFSLGVTLRLSRVGPRTMGSYFVCPGTLSRHPPSLKLG
jgi:hypothetical protein